MNLAPGWFAAIRLLSGRTDGTDRKKRVSGGLGGAILGIAMSMIPLVLVMVVSDGMIRGITARYVETGTYHIQAAVPGALAWESLSGVAARVASVPGVTAAFPEVQGPAVAATGSGTHAAFVRAVDPAFFSQEGTRAYLLVREGRTAPLKPGEIVVGEALADALKLRVGSTLTMVTSSTGAGATGAVGAQSPAPRLSIFKVAGIVSAGYRELDAIWAFVSPEAIGRVFPSGAGAAFIGIKTADPHAASLAGIASDVAAGMAAEFGSDYDPGYVRNWQQAQRSLYRSFATTKQLLLVIMALAVIVAALNLGSAMGLFVAERRMDIAVMRATGAAGGTVSGIFLLAGGITGAAGTAVGLAAGMLLSWRVNDLISAIEWVANLAARALALVSGTPPSTLRLLDPAYYLEKIPVVIDVSQVAVTAIASVCLCVLAALLPAGRAGSIPPMELVRKS